MNQQNVAIITEKNITMDDFDIEIDPITGEFTSLARFKKHTKLTFLFV
jgi:hypothetical protein